MATRKKKENNNNGIQDLQLAGNVKVTVVRKDKVMRTFEKHNTATLYLFKGIAYSLRKDILANESLEAYLPNYIAVGTGTEELKVGDTKLGNQLGNRFKITSEHEPNVTETSCEITFRGKIPYSVIGGSKVTEIGLFGTSESNSLLSGVNISETGVSAGESLIIDWTIAIENKKDEENKVKEGN